MWRAIFPVAVVVVSACGSRSDLTDDGSSIALDAGVDGDTDGTVPVAGSYVLSVNPKTLTVTQGGVAVTLGVHVERQGSFVDEVDVDVPILPLGVTATTAVFLPGVTDATINFEASLQATQGQGPPINVRATTVAAGQEVVPIDLFVRGCPGCLDTTFGTQGFAPFTADFPNLIAVDSTDRIILGVWSGDTQSLLGFSPDGTLDTTFGDSVSPYGAFSTQILVGADGSFTLAGTTAVASALAKFTSTGKLDTTFGSSDGLFDYPYTSPFECNFSAVVAAANGSLAALESCSDPTQTTYVAFSKLIGVLPSGAVDTTFANAGQASFPWTAIDATGSLMIHTADDHVVVVGDQQNSNTDFHATLDLARFDAHGVVDPTFGANGQVVTQIQIIQGAAIATTDGGVVVCGLSIDTLASMFVKFQSTGALDTTFGIGGVLRLEPLPASTTAPHNFPNNYASGIVSQSDGKLVALGIGETGYNQSTSYLVRLNADGTYDHTFANNGVLLLNYGEASTEITVGPALQSDGRIVVAGGKASWDDKYTTFITRYWL